MRIESGTTGEHWWRSLIMVLMFGLFAVWFGYDGLIGYPAKNLEWAKKMLPQKPDQLETNPLVTMDKQSQISAGMTIEKLESLLGQPALVQQKKLVFIGREITAHVFIENKKVVNVTTKPTDADEKNNKPNLLVRVDKVDQIKPGMSKTELISTFTQPHEVREKTLWYVGPATYARIEAADGKVAKFEFQENQDKTEGDILWQKRFAVGLAMVTVILLVKFIRTTTSRTVLDDTGLTMGSRRVAWDEMTGLSVDEYREKGWVDLEYNQAGVARTLRLDSYHLNLFDEIVGAICEKKGFSLPGVSGSDDVASSQQTSED